MENNSLNEIVNSDLGLVYLGNAERCAPCAAFVHHFNETLDEIFNFMGVKFLKIQASHEDPVLSELHKIVKIDRGIPQFFIFQNGVCVWQHAGYRGPIHLMDALKQFKK